MPSGADRPSFTEEQLSRYFTYIKLPEAARKTAFDVHSQDSATQLDFLGTLTRHQLCAVPFESLDLHYNPIKGISLNSDHLFHKIVERNAGRGGYCMQNNSFFATVLRSIGYKVMSVGGRVSSAMDGGREASENAEDISFGGYAHQVNIVTIGDRKFFVDVGFGSPGPTGPVPLEHGYTALNTGTKDNVASSMRLTKGFVGNNTSKNAEQELWVYSVKYGRSDDQNAKWLPCYCFSETEFFPADFEIMSHWVSTNRASIFLQWVICQKFIMSEDGESLIGDVTLQDGAVKERRFGENKTLAEFKNEGDRVEALEKYLGVKLSQAEIDGIAGFPSAIK